MLNVAALAVNVDVIDNENEDDDDVVVDDDDIVGNVDFDFPL